MKTYNATAVREGTWWVVEVPDVGVTQGRTTHEAERMAADLIAVMRGAPLDQIVVKIEFRLNGN